MGTRDCGWRESQQTKLVRRYEPMRSSFPFLLVAIVALKVAEPLTVRDRLRPIGVAAICRKSWCAGIVNGDELDEAGAG